ncbi:hypothetical protein [Candidatus Symbiopectobacterium sp.]|nr:hypothetical protein [Candidatus Symbiopectobacterium sp.]
MLHQLIEYTTQSTSVPHAFLRANHSRCSLIREPLATLLSIAIV